MKTLGKQIMKSLIALTALCVPAYAGNCHVQQARVINHQQVVVANAIVIPQNFIAVPVAQPLAVPSYYGYQYLPQYAAAVGYGSSAIGHPEPTYNKVEPEEVRAMRERIQIKPEEAPLPMSLVSQHCAKCHKPAGSAWKKTELDLTGELSNATRLHMIQRILSDDPAKRMPRGKPLDAQAIGLLIQELSQVPTPAQPKPEPEK